LDDIIQMTFPVDPRIKDKVQSEIRTTVSELPLTVNDTVLGYINYFNGRGRRTIEGGLARSGKYRAMISRVLAEEGVPQELIHLAQAESGFQPRALSNKAAGGLWQFVKFRGNQYGLMQTPYSDERLDPEKATRAAARHLHDLYNEFGDWYLAIAAYNCGPGVIERAVAQTGFADFFELRNLRVLPNETANYVPIILAMTIMAKNAAAYGLDNVVMDEPVEYDTIKTVSPTSMALIGDLTNTAVPELLHLNPALLKNTAPANFEIRVPKGTGTDVTSIARLFNATPAQILAANTLTESEVAPGSRLVIPAVYHEPVVASAHTAPRPAAHTTAKPKAASTTVAHAAVAHKAQPVVAKPVVHKSGVAIAQAKPAASSLNR
jgi:membrane-bound lytic murein transglycosylase D